jgi:hypothetical protein
MTNDKIQIPKQDEGTLFLIWILKFDICRPGPS